MNTVIWRLRLVVLTVTLSFVLTRTSGGETSGEYLQKVMIELQELNVPSTVDGHDRLSTNVENVIYKDEKSDAVNTRQNVQKHRNEGHLHYIVVPTDKVDPAIFSQHQEQVPKITKLGNPESLGFTRAELAAMYKNALEKGSAINLSALTTALAAGNLPQVTKTHLELPAKQPLYQYYFFPLKTFMSEFTKDHGYKTIPASAPDNTAAMNTAQTQLANPLFMAISTFVTMAIVFMLGVLFLPKFTHFDVIHAREIQDDFSYMSNLVTNAIDRYNVLETFRENDLNLRFNFPSKTKEGGNKKGVAGQKSRSAKHDR